jgi:thiamine biosynthesis lipoprotein
MTEIPKNGTGPTRRQVLTILAAGGMAGLGWRLGLIGTTRPVAASQSAVLMGTAVNLTVVGDDQEAAAAAVAATLGRMKDLEALLSRHAEGSEVSRLNRTGRLDGASDALIDLLRTADRISRLGDGAFDVTIQPLLELYRGHLAARHELPPPEGIERTLDLLDHRSIRIEGRSVSLARPGMAITLDGIGKGYIVDAGVAVMKERGFPNVLVEAGGDLVANGERQPGQPWRVGIRTPRGRIPRLQARVDAADRAVTTSGDYMQPFTPDLAQHHILDPRTGYSAPDLASSTVTAPTAALADGLSTLTMVLGPRRSRELLEALPACEGYLVSKDLEVTMTSGFALA